MPIRMIFAFLFFASCASNFTWCASHVAAADPPISEVDEPGVTKLSFEKSSVLKPLVLRSVDGAEPYFTGKGLTELKQQVDFDKQFVLLFAWKGSGRDELSYAVAESYPEQIMFTYAPGRTRDLRPHVHVFVLRSNVQWSVK